MQLQKLIEFLERVFPLELAEEWDNVGLLVGDRRREIKKVLACLTVDSQVVDEAIEFGADCIVSHHPFPFKESKKWTADSPNGRLFLKLVAANIAVYSPHTAHDSAFFGVNRELAEGLELTNIRSLYPGKLVASRDMLDGLDAADAQNLAKELEKRGGKDESAPLLGTGRIGRLPKTKTFAELVAQVKEMLQVERLLVVGDDAKKISTVAVGCGAADEFVEQAAKEGAEVLLLGEARFHACLEARERNLCLILAGHYSTERFSMCFLADRLSRKFPELIARASERESDPLRVV